MRCISYCHMPQRNAFKVREHAKNGLQISHTHTHTYTHTHTHTKKNTKKTKKCTNITTNTNTTNNTYTDLHTHTNAHPITHTHTHIYTHTHTHKTEVKKFQHPLTKTRHACLPVLRAAALCIEESLASHQARRLRGPS